MTTHHIAKSCRSAFWSPDQISLKLAKTASKRLKTFKTYSGGPQRPPERVAEAVIAYGGGERSSERTAAAVGAYGDGLRPPQWAAAAAATYGHGERPPGRIAQTPPHVTPMCPQCHFDNSSHYQIVPIRLLEPWSKQSKIGQNRVQTSQKIQKPAAGGPKDLLSAWQKR